MSCRAPVTQQYQNSGDIVPTLPFGFSWRHVGLARPISACSGPAAGQGEAEAAAATATATAAVAARRLLRGGPASLPARPGVEVGSPLDVRAHLIDAYLRVLFSCLSSHDRARVPDPDSEVRLQAITQAAQHQ